MFGYIYITYVIPARMWYIGQKKGLPENSRKYFGSGTDLSVDIAVFGKSNCRKWIVDLGHDQEHLNDIEKKWIAQFGAVASPDFYNNHEGGNVIGSPRAPQTRAKIGAKTKKRAEDPKVRKELSDRAKKQMEDPAMRDKIRQTVLKSVATPEYRNLRSEISRRLFDDPEYRRRHSEARIGVIQSAETIAKRVEKNRKSFTLVSPSKEEVFLLNTSGVRDLGVVGFQPYILRKLARREINDFKGWTIKDPA